MFVLVLGRWKLRAFMRAFVLLLFGVAGKCSLILLLSRPDFCVDLESLNGPETTNLLFSLRFLTLSVMIYMYMYMECYYHVFLNLFLFVFDFCLSISSPEVSANCNFLFEASTILFFVKVHFHGLFLIVFHLILRANSEVVVLYLSHFFVILFICFLCFYTIFSCVLQMLLAFP